MNIRAIFRQSSVVLLLITVSVMAGCNALKTDRDRWLSPDKVISAPRQDIGLVRAIRLSVDPADQETELVPNSESPRPSDLRYSDDDYIIGAGDIVDISILDLFSEGQEIPLRRQVTEKGFIDLPLLSERIQAEDRTKEGLKEAIKEAYSPEILINPTVSVTIIAQRANTFSILGAVDRPSQYSIIRRDLRLLGALALAGGIRQSNIRYIYVIRQSPPVVEKSADTKSTTLPPLPKIPADVQPTQPAKSNDEDKVHEAIRALLGQDDDDSGSAPSIVPHYSEATGAGVPGPASATAEATSKKANDAEERTSLSPDKMAGKPETAPATSTSAATDKAAPAASSRQEPKEPVAPSTRKGPLDPLQWSKASSAGLNRIIAIDLKALRNGDEKMNIVVRDRDVIHVPALEMGEFYIGGEVLRPGVYSLQGRQITIKQAVFAAGNLAPLAWPENSTLTRRVGDAQEQTIPINIEKIFQGQTRDIYLKPNDVIAVGTNWKAPFLAVVRNAFRMTYGFGFIYDRNFANRNFGGMNSNRFKRW